MYTVHLTLKEANAMITALDTRRAELRDLLENCTAHNPRYPAEERRLMENIATLTDCIDKLHNS